MSLREPINAPAAPRVPLKGDVELAGHWLFAEPALTTPQMLFIAAVVGVGAWIAGFKWMGWL